MHAIIVVANLILGNMSSDQLGTPPRPNRLPSASVISGNSPPMAHQQTKLDEITNKVFNELLQQRVDAHSHDFGLPPQITATKQQQHESSQKHGSDHDAIARSDDMNSESSSNVAYRLQSAPVPKARTIIGTSKQRSVAAVGTPETKRPLIAKWKTGAKLHNTAANSENNGE